MQTTVIAIVTTVIGVVSAVLVSRHYFRRSSKHYLAIYALPSVAVLRAADSQINRDLDIRFRGQAVTDLCILELLVANEGVSAVRAPIRPLTVTIKDGCSIVDASVTYIHPEGRDVEVRVISAREFSCIFDLLNTDEYFYVKLITDGQLDSYDLDVAVTAEDLPPRLEVKSGYSAHFEDDDRRFKPGLLIGALVFFLISASVLLPMVALYESKPSYFPYVNSKFVFVWWLTPAMTIAGIVALVIALVGFGLIGGWMTEGSPVRKKGFKRPARPHSAQVYGYGYGMSSSTTEAESAVSRYPRE